jgi:hypothetical protein
VWGESGGVDDADSDDGDADDAEDADDESDGDADADDGAAVPSAFCVNGNGGSESAATAKVDSVDSEAASAVTVAAR